MCMRASNRDDVFLPMLSPKPETWPVVKTGARQAGVCGPCAEVLAAAPHAAGGFEGADGGGGVGGTGGGEAGEAGQASGQHEKQMRNVLTEEGALRIFRCKEQHRTRDDLSERLAQEYGITPKAVRDIWNLRTWMNTTRHILKSTFYSAFV